MDQVRAVVQRVNEASVEVGGRDCATIGAGLLIYLGIAPDDTPVDVDYLADKVAHLRIFPDDKSQMNRDVGEVGGDVLVVSAFTVQADARRGRRPSFDSAAPQATALPLYEKFCDALSATGLGVQRGAFGEHMKVRSINDGPISVLLDSRRTF